MAQANGDIQDTSQHLSPAASSVASSSRPIVATNGHDHSLFHHHHHHEHKYEGYPDGGGLFQITIKLPHDPYTMSLAVTSQEQLQDLRQSIVEFPATFQYTCFHLEHNHNRINDFVELSEVEGLKPNSQIFLVEDPYTEKEARMHVIRIRELIGAAQNRVDSIHGIGAGIPLHNTRASCSDASSGEKSTSSHPLSTFDIDAPASLFSIVQQRQESLPRTLKSISVSPWNPPPRHLRLRGHLLYLQVTTNEGDQFQITSAVSGFFINRSSGQKFDPFPRAAPKNHKSHSLLSLLHLISPSFTKSFTDLQAVNSRKDPLATFPFQNAIPASPWLVPSPHDPLNQHQPDQTRAQEPYLVGGVDNVDTMRDWNEEFQTTKELPREDVQDRVFRERLTSKLFADYTEAATRGAALVARGEVAPLNPTEAADAQIFVYNNIFFSFGADGVQTFAGEGGDEAARVAVGKDVVGVRAVNQLDIQDLYTPGTVVVDYLGKRIVGQSIIPGIFKQREPGQPQIDYGGVEGRDVVSQNEAFDQVFENLSRALRVKKHAVWDKEGTRHDLEGSIETKGLLGTDARKYVLDLYRVTPLDIIWAEEAEAMEDVEFGTYPHRMATLRLELVEAYRRMKLQEYVKDEIEKNQKKPNDDGSGPETQPDPTADDMPGSGDVVTTSEKGVTGQAVQNREAEGQTAQELVDLSKFSFLLNPDICSGQVPQTTEEKRAYEEDEETVRAVCTYLRTDVLEEFIQDLHENDVGYPMDGRSLCQLLHKRGINLRYLGKVTKLAAEKGDRLRALVKLTTQEMIVRAFKHVTNRFLRHLPLTMASYCISHLLNCFLGTRLNTAPSSEVDAELKELYPSADFSFEKVTPASLREEIEQQVSVRYRHHLAQGWWDDMKLLQTFRETCLRLGLQLAALDYDFGIDRFPTTQHSVVCNGHESTNGNTLDDQQKKKKRRGKDLAATNGGPTRKLTTFRSDDILNILPIVRDAAPRSILAEEALEAGRISLQQNQKQLGQELILESLSLHEQIYGILHPEVAKIYHQLSMIYFQTGENAPAIELARKAVIVTERTLGVDSADAVLAYLNLSLFEHSVGNTMIALEHIKHALSVWKLIYGSYHPDSITTMNNAAVMLQALRQYSDSRKWFEASLAVCVDLFGRSSVNVATILFQLAQALALDQDSKAAVNRMREAYNIFLGELGPEDRNTKEAENWLEQLTHNAVSIAKHAKDIQNRRLRRIQLAPSISLGTRPQPEVGRNITEVVHTRASSVSSSHPSGLDSRSIDELLKFIEGADGGSSPQAKQKKRARAMNPKLRSRAKEA